MQNSNPGRLYLFLINPFINQGRCELKATTSENNHILNSLEHICTYVFVHVYVFLFTKPVYHVQLDTLCEHSCSYLAWGSKLKGRLRLSFCFISFLKACYA